MKNYLFLILLSFLCLGCNRDGEIIVIFENSSSQPMKMILYKNNVLIDSIDIEAIEQQQIQISMRKKYKISDGDILNFKELNSGEHFEKKFGFPFPKKSFIVLGLGTRSRFYLDTITYSRELPVM